MKLFKWPALALAVGSVVWSVVMGVKIWVTPVRYLHYSSAEPAPRFVYESFSDVSGLGAAPLVVPVLLAGLATWAAWRQRAWTLTCVAPLFWVFCVISGFSIGGAYLPAAGALLAAVAPIWLSRVRTRRTS